MNWGVQPPDNSNPECMLMMRKSYTIDEFKLNVSPRLMTTSCRGYAVISSVGVRM